MALAFVWSMEYVRAPPSRMQEWILAQELFWGFMKIRMDMKKGIPEKDTKEVFRHHWEVVEESELSDSGGSCSQTAVLGSFVVVPYVVCASSRRLVLYSCCVFYCLPCLCAKRCATQP